MKGELQRKVLSEEDMNSMRSWLKDSFEKGINEMMRLNKCDRRYAKTLLAVGERAKEIAEVFRNLEVEKYIAKRTGHEDLETRRRMRDEMNAEVVAINATAKRIAQEEYEKL